MAEDLGAERNRITNRLREQLWRYFPAMLEQSFVAAEKIALLTGGEFPRTDFLTAPLSTGDRWAPSED